MEITGKLLVKGETQTLGSNGFQKREFVIETEDNYPQQIQIELIKDKCAILDKFQIGQEVKVSININGRAWTNPQGKTKYFLSLQGWRIEAGTAPQPQDFEMISQNQGGALPDNDDLPFAPIGNF